ncbi:MAG: ribonuclease R [Betaproteobacteria bacterium]|nr:ribonuclease R [Betaproteobacteria bacterium]NBT09874.1 ribonuclease R [Betaproteobacteria bacterium]NBU49722.1 ribonuclease R [Betaproteobacteria bacterium]
MIKKSKNSSSTAALLHEVEGTVQGHRDGHGFLLTDEGGADIYLAPQEMRAVLHGDRLRVRVVGTDRRGRPEGRIVDILDRPSRPIIGRLLQEGGVWVVAPEDRRYGQDILIPKNGVATAQVGQVVCVELTEAPSMYTQPSGRVTEVLGEIDDPGMEIEIAVRKYEVPHRFTPEALAQAAALPEKIRPVDRRQRVDLCDVPLVTIDGEDARDFDDAVFCEPAAFGKGRQAFKGWRLVVAIADVSHYVKPGEALDVDAYERATSVYFPRRVIPMLPEKISNGLCSLNPLEDRLSMVCDMLVSEDGEVTGYQFFPAVICSHARLTYTEVGAALTNTRGPEAARLGPLLPHLLHLHEVYRALLRQRTQRGAIDFESTETQIVCDDNGRIEKIVPRTRNEAHRLIEEAMLAANVCAADFIESHSHPALFRVHEGPTPEKRVTLQNYLRALGLGLAVSDEPKPAEFQAISKAVRDRPDAQQIQTMLLRSMQQAIYTAVNSGHFGLAYEAYAHFTSPIRRYPDLLVHRVIKAILLGKRYHLGPLPAVSSAATSGSYRRPGRGGTAAGLAAGAGPAVPSKPGKAAVELALWQTAGEHCSANERRADEASRDVEAWLKCRYMRDRLGEEFAGTVSAATSFGLFVQLDELYVEGLIHITELGGEYYRFDEVRQELRGERTGVRYAVGSRVRVQVSRVDLDGRRIDFRMVRDGVADPARVGSGPRGKAGPAKGAKAAGGSKAGHLAREASGALPGGDESAAGALTPVQEWAHIQLSDRQLRQAARKAREAASGRGLGSARKASPASKSKKTSKAVAPATAGRKAAATKAGRKSAKKRG